MPKHFEHLVLPFRGWGFFLVLFPYDGKCHSPFRKASWWVLLRFFSLLQNRISVFIIICFCIDFKKYSKLYVKAYNLLNKMHLYVKKHIYCLVLFSMQSDTYVYKCHLYQRHMEYSCSLNY
jgi:hypothetical protein